MRMLQQHRCPVLKTSFIRVVVCFVFCFNADYFVFKCIGQTRLAGTRCIGKFNNILSSRHNSAIEDGKWYFKAHRNSMVQGLKHNTIFLRLFRQFLITLHWRRESIRDHDTLLIVPNCSMSTCKKSFSFILGA